MTVTLYNANTEPIKNQAFTFTVALLSQANGFIFKTTPTLAAGDVLVSIDGANFANIGTLPTQIQTTGVLAVALTSSEMNGNRIEILFHDAAGAEWQDALITIYTKVAVSVGTSDLQGVAQTGDSYARLGAPAGVSIAADIAAIETTVAISSTQAAAIATGQLAISAGYTFKQQITSTSTDDLSAATKLWLAVKLNSGQVDSASQIFIEKTAGLTVVAGAAYATVAHGSLTVGGSSGAWTIDIYIHDIATALLFGIGSDLRVAGLKYTKAGAAADDLSAWDGTAVITDGIVRAVS